MGSSGSHSVSPETTTTYTATATGPGGTSRESVTITVVEPPPTLSLHAEPVTILAGDSTILSWTGIDVDTLSLNQGIGTVEAAGFVTVSPAETTTNTLIGRGPGGTAEKSVTITVSHPLPTATFTADKKSLNIGESAVITWTSAHADTVSIEPGIGTISLNGTMTLTVAETTTYTLTATGPGGTTAVVQTVTVTYPAPVVSFSADQQLINTGDSVTLSWTSLYGDIITIEPDIGTVEPNGSITLTPAETTAYTLTVTGPGGTSELQLSVEVLNNPLTLEITSPVEGETITRPVVMVTGTVSHANGLETGVMVSPSLSP